MIKKLKVEAIVPVAGMGTRLKSKQPKPFVLLKGKPLFFYTVSALEKSALIDNIILAANPKYVEVFQKLVKRFGFKKVKTVVKGGETRQQSVFNGLQAVDENTNIVVVHDGARPFITPKLIDESVKLCLKKKAVIVAVPVKPTIKRVNAKSMQVVESLKREELWDVQTPQVFEKNLLLKAHKLGKNLKATDDAFLVEKLKIKVSVLQGSYDNIKITTNEDLDVAAMILRKRQ